MALHVQIDNMFVPRHGLERAWYDELAEDRFPAIHREVEEQRRGGLHGFYDLADGGELVDTIERFAEGAGQAFENVVVIGIGGSATGTRALRAGLLGPWWNELSSEARDYYPRLYVLDNVDPDTIGQFTRSIGLGNTLFNVVSKSGATVETAALFLIVRHLLEAELGEGYRRHLVITTDPREGPLRAIAERESIAALPIPANVGGCFSVLTAVGLLPAALAGIDIRALLRGAQAMRERCVTSELPENPAGQLAATLYLADTRRSANVHVFMSYSDLLRDAAVWLGELWAEGLGKLAGDGSTHVGPTPVVALGATDQHSQLQLWLEGPFNKVIVFLTAQENAHELEIPRWNAAGLGIEFLGGRNLGELLRIEAAATQEALTQAGRPNLSVDLPRVGAFELGELFMLGEISTVYAARLYGVDPLETRGVEHAKQLLHRKLRGTG